jgi:hypothetical protein
MAEKKKQKPKPPYSGKTKTVNVNSAERTRSFKDGRETTVAEKPTDKKAASQEASPAQEGGK